ncbi:hypothetical protein evm_003645 [Chilo suppressalis]|nr:hypothetical protein evm_003645 [Chilo suppressalis]
MESKLLIIILLCQFEFIRKIGCELSPETVASLLQTYATNVNSSIILSKSDRNLLNSWNDEFQLKRVNITTKFRLQMMKHKDHNFQKGNFDKKWIKCMDIYSNEIDGSERMYYENESDCLKTVNMREKDSRKGLDQIEREIKRWRKSYKYLLHLCDINHPDDVTNAGVCLVEYIEKDGYNLTLQRLMSMKIEAMQEFYRKLTISMDHLEECFKVNLSSYLNNVRTVMESLNRCYNGFKNDNN